MVQRWVRGFSLDGSERVVAGNNYTTLPRDEPLPSAPPEPETQPQHPFNPTVQRRASIPTYNECLDGSERIVNENNYVTLPTDEPRPSSNNNRTVDDLPPTYEDVQENQNLYAVAE
jgi:hypothetical protein